MQDKTFKNTTEDFKESTIGSFINVLYKATINGQDSETQNEIDKFNKLNNGWVIYFDPGMGGRDFTIQKRKLKN